MESKLVKFVLEYKVLAKKKKKKKKLGKKGKKKEKWE